MKTTRTPIVRPMLLGLLLAGAMLPGCSDTNGPEPAESSEPAASAPAARVPMVPDDPDAILANNRACGLMGRFDYRDARDVFAGLVEQYPNWVDAKVNLAIATLNRQDDGDETLALDILMDALTLDPDHPRAHFCVGILLSRTADPAAKDHFARVVELDPDDPYAAYFHASALEEQGDAAGALAGFERSLELDPYLRSSYHRLSQLKFRAGETEAGKQMAEIFQRLDDNPRARLVKIIYTKMGPNAMVATVGLDVPPARTRPDGTLFKASEPVESSADTPWSSDPRSSMTIADVDDDGDLDVIVARAFDDWDGRYNAIIVNDGAGSMTLDPDHSLAGISAANALLWGDVDEDGLTDLYVCRDGANQLWMQVSPGQWVDHTDETGTANDRFDTVDGALVDADHDGDLDVFCVNADGPNELLNNNRDGTFRPIAEQQGIDGGAVGSRQVLFTDLDGDRDADIIVLHAEPPHQVFINDRLWSYAEDTASLASLCDATIHAIAAGDLGADGSIELMTTDDDGAITIWERTEGQWSGRALRDGNGGDLALLDLDGDADLDLVTAGATGWEATDVETATRFASGEMPCDGGWTAAYLDPAAGWSMIARAAGAAPRIARPGPGRYGFSGITVTGREDTGDGMRSNTSGIGVEVAARLGDRWSILHTFDATSAPGQSLQPLPIGLAGREHIDFVEIQWPDGVFQSEVHGLSPQVDTPRRNLALGHVETIEEIQRLKSSCPVIFAWNGERLEFVSDVLGVAGLGYLVAPGEYATPRPWENFLMPESALAARDGRYVLTVAEPMEEACYLDRVGLVAYDLPPKWSMTVDERMRINGPEPTGEPRFYQRLVRPVRAVNERGQDVTADVRAVDAVAAPIGPRDDRFLGRLRAPHVLTLEFDQPLGASEGESLILLADGWVEYPYAQTMFAAWQAGATYDAPTLEARDRDGAWHVLLDQFGYPAGMPRQMSVPLPALPPGCTALRLSTNQEIYWDALAVAASRPTDDVRRTELPALGAELQLVGFPAMTWTAQKRPYYDRGLVQADWDTRHQRGDYTPFGDVQTLLTSADGALAVFGPGEEVIVEFDGILPDLPEGWTRRFVLELDGWCKDMDLFTADGETVHPLPPGAAWPEGVGRRTDGGR